MRKAQYFLEKFRQRGPDSTEFFYGLEGNDPFSSLLFYRQSKDGDRPFSFALRESTFLFPDALENVLNMSPTDTDLDTTETIEFTAQMRKCLFCVMETYTRRISTKKVQCSICGRRVDISAKADHFLTKHADFLRESLESNSKILNEDNDEDMVGFFDKLEFDMMISRPKKMFLPWRENGTYITAPPIRPVPAERMFPLPLDTGLLGCDFDSDDIIFKYRGFTVPPLNHFASKHKPVEPLVDDLPDFGIDHQAAEQLLAGILENTYNLDEKKAMLIEAEQQLEMELAKQRDQKLKATWTDEELDVKTAELPKTGQTVKQQPRHVPFLETIPANVRDDVIRRLATTIVSSYVATQANQVIRPVLQSRKRQHQKQMKEEKQRRARDEERQRITEMRKRRQLAIEKMSVDVTRTIVNGFIRQEICNIFNEELQLRLDELAEKEEENQSEALNIPPVVVSGLCYQRHLSLAFLRELFGQYSFKPDDDGGPKIRYRRNGNRYDVLLYLASIRDVNRILAQKSIVVDYAALQFRLDEPSQVETCTSFTGQEITISPTAKHLENFDPEKCRADFCRACPVLALDTVEKS